MRIVLAFLLVGCVLGVAGEADAQVLTFDEMAPDPLQNLILGTVECSAGTGFRFSSDHFHLIAPNFGPLFSSSGTTHMGFESGRGFPITMVREGGGTFSLTALDAGEFYANHDPERPDAEWITLTGTQANGAIVEYSFFLDGIRDGVGGVADFQHFTLPNTFVNLRSVVFTGWRQGNVAGGLAIDNLEYQLAPVDSLPACTFHALPSDIPSVAFVSPSAGVVSGTVPIEATATDNVAVAQVVFKLNGVALAAPDVSAPYTLQFDTTAVPDGAYTLTAEARDGSNNVGTASLAITIQNGIVISDGPHYVEIDGVDDHLLVPDAPSLSFGNGTADTPMTLEMWLRPDAVSVRHHLIGKAGEYKVSFIYGTVMVELRDQSTQSTATIFTNGVNVSALVGGWHHLAVTYDGRGGATAANGVTIYLDGVAVPVWRSTDAGYVAMENGTSALMIGRESESGNQYDGGLDELRMWNVLRTAGQLQAGMGLELTGTEPGLVGYWRFNEGVGWSAADASPSNLSAALMNGTAWAADGPLAPDTTAPQIANIAVSNVTSVSATITFTTNEVSTGWVSYAAGAACPCSDVYSASVGTQHTITLTGLTSNTTYRYEAKARDAANNQQGSAILTFQTLAPDTQAPTVAIVNPGTAAVAGVVQIDATASDNVGVSSVEFNVNGVSLGAPDTSAPYRLAWDTTALADGTYTLTAEARDAAGNVGTAVVAVTVQNGNIVTVGPHYVELDGVNDGIRVGDTPALSFGNGTADTPFTLEMWLRPDVMTGRHQLIGKAGEYRVAFIYGNLVIELRDQSSQSFATVSTNSLTSLTGGWHHLAVTYDGRGGSGAANGISAYIDGVAVFVWRSTDGGYVAMEDLASPVEIGRESEGTNQYDGGLDELRVWNVLRTPGQLQAVMGAELTGAEAGLVAYWRFNEGIGTAVADDSPNSATAMLLNGTAWAVDGPLAPDTTAPQITNIVVSSVTSTSATITFTTDEAATGRVSYAAGTACPCTDVYSAAVGTQHTVTLTGLSANTSYRYEVKATDAANNQRTSAVLNFQTLPPDTQAPMAAVVTPAAGTVSGVVQINATATDNVGVASVEFKVNGVSMAAPDASAPYALAWDTTALADGTYTLTAEARDAAGNIGTTAVVLTLQNGNVVIEGPHYVELDGVNDGIRIADTPALSFGNGTADTPLTLEMWLRPDVMTGRHQLFGKAGEYRVAFIYGSVLVELRDQSSQSLVTVSTNSLTSLTGGWHHLAVTYDGRGGANAANGVSIYVDGVAVFSWRSTDAGYVAMENLASPVEVGRESEGTNQYDGGLDELRVWNVLRTPGQLQTAMGAELTGAEAGLVAYWRFNEGIGTAVADDSPNSATAALVNGPVWAVDGPLAPDTTAPQITNIVVSNVTSASATITFTTNEAATGRVSYAAGAACPCTDVYSAAAGTQHTVTLTGLSANTNYRYEVKATDAANNQRTSAVLNFQTLPPDLQAPTVAVNTPAPGTVSGLVTIDATAGDNVGVVSVDFKVNGVSLAAPDTSAPYTMAWDTTTLVDGLYTLRVEARDAANNLGFAEVAVTLQNGIVVTEGPHYVELDGVNDGVRVADTPALSFGNGTADTPLTLEMWLRPDALMGRHQLFGKAGEYRVAFIYGSLLVELRDQSSQSLVTVSTNSLASLVGSWHHVAVTYDGRGGANAANGVSIYVDGTAVFTWRDTDGGYVAMENLAAPVEIGRESEGTNQYDGGLDELRVWNVLRTAGELQAGMTAELTGTETGLVAYWRFNEGIGSAVADDSPNAATAQLMNGTAWAVNGPIPH